MKTLLFSCIAVLFLTSCSSVRVSTDYDTAVHFNDFHTFAFFKPGIDKAEISDLDKKRILRAIDSELSAKGFEKSENPDILVSIFTKSNERVDVYQNHFGWGGMWGWGWGHPWASTSVSTTTEGTLYIDIINAKNKELIWQGMGTASLPSSMEKKETKIRTIVAKILEKYPPGSAH